MLTEIKKLFRHSHPQPATERVNNAQPIIRFGGAYDGEREWFIDHLLKPSGIPDDRIKRSVHGGLQSFSVAKLTETEYSAMMKTFLSISQQKKEEDLAEGLGRGFYDDWFFGMGMRIWELGGAYFTGIPSSSVRTGTVAEMETLFRTQCNPTPLPSQG